MGAQPTYLFGATVWDSSAPVAASSKRPPPSPGAVARSGVRDDKRTPYYCDGCNFYFHHGCAENQSKGRQAPLCPSCHAQALAGGRGSRRRMGR